MKRDLLLENHLFSAKIISKTLDDEKALEDMKYENERNHLARFGIDLSKSIRERKLTR